jgi:hypothetical protein
LRHASGQQSCGEPTRLQNHNLAIREQSMFQEHLRHLRGFAGTGWGGNHQSPIALQPSDNLAFDFVDGQLFRHARGNLAALKKNAKRKS